MSRYINLFTDFGFKRVFGTEENKDILMDFLNEVLQVHHVYIQDLSYKKTDQLGEHEEDRITIFDLYCVDNQGKHFTVELQKAKQTFFKDRMLYYTSRVIQNQGVKGEWNYQLQDVYLVALMNFVFEPEPSSVISNIKLLDIENHQVFYDKLGFTTIELPKFQKSLEICETNLDKWLYILKHLPDMKTIPGKLQTKVFEKLFNLTEYTALNSDEKDAYEESLKRYNDLKNSIETAVAEKTTELTYLLEEAKQREEEERKQKVELQADLAHLIQNLLSQGFDIQTIGKMLGKSEEEIQKLSGL